MASERERTPRIAGHRRRGSKVWCKLAPMDERRRLPRRPARDAGVTAWLLARYFALVVPRARAELQRWRATADAISDDPLRRAATATLGRESLLAEAAAVFGVLVPAAHRRPLTRLTVAFQVLYDFVDTLGEQPGYESPEAGMRLFRLLEAAATPGAAIEPGHDGGSYVAELVGACQACVTELPSTAVALPAIRRAIRRCCEGQSYTHATMHEGPARLAAWSVKQDRAGALEWWEVAGAAISSLAVHALFAAAATPGTTRADTDLIDAAYFPWACALSTLLDSLIDRAEDAAALGPNHRGLSYYSSDAEAAERIASIAVRSLEATSLAPHNHSHATIVLGVAAWYLSSPDAASVDNVAIARPVREALGPRLTPVLAALRVRRGLKAS